MKFCMSCMEPYEEGDKCPKCGFSGNVPVNESIHLSIGSVVKDRYTVGMVLSADAFGASYVAWDRKLGRKVILQEYLPGEFATRVPGKTVITVFSDSKKQKQFHDGLVKLLEEADKLRQLPADNGIAQVLDSFSFNNTAYVVTEALEGETLAQRLKRDTTMPAAEAIALILPVLNSLQLVHSQGMIHGDICPENIFITTDGRVKLINFAAYRTATTFHSRSLSVLIKSGYSAEEQYRSRSDQGSYTDVYSLGAVLYRMITGTVPPDAFERRIAFERGKHDIIKPFRRGVPHGQAIAIMNALNVRIEDRTQQAADFAKELTSDKKVARKGNRIRVVDNGKMKKGILVGSAIAMLCIASVAVLFATGIINFGDGGFGLKPLPQGMTRVPSVIGKDLTGAQELLSSAKLRASIHDKQYSKEIPADYILLQDIRAGSIVDINTVVSLTVSGGQEMKLVPLVEGETIENAEKILNSLGFVVKTEKSPSLYKSEGIVFSQDVEANTELAVGETITLKVSNGEVIKGVAYIETVPDLTGMTLTEAAEKLMALASSGKNDGKPFGIDENTEKAYSKTVPAGRIISQNLKPGTQEMTDKSFKFTVSLGIHYVMLPDVQYQPIEDAKENLNLGGESQFTLSISEANDENVARGHVISQSPAGGTKVEFDSQVSLVVSLGPKEFPMPRVNGKTKEDAAAELEKYGITNIAYAEARHDDIPKGSIIAQNPAARDTVTSKTNVELTVSAGKILRLVPNVTNRERADAEYSIQQEKLIPIIYEEYSDTVAQGHVISQSPTTGELETGSEVVLVISKGRKPVQVPNVTGQAPKVAEQTLNGIRLNVIYETEEYDEEIPEGAVKSQEPKAGQQALEGDTVTLIVSKGPSPVVVPDVRNKEEVDAGLTLKSKHFDVSFEYKESTEVDKGRVIYQEPSAGTSAPRDSMVTIYVSKGIQVPDLAGETESAARTKLAALNLKSAVNYQESTTVQKGKVIAQHPPASEYVSRNETITFYVSSGTSVPDVTGYDQANADRAIRAAGLEVSVQERESRTVPIGRVISQNPYGGKIASAGDIVTITVSSGVKVPDVVEYTQSRAESMLKSAGFAVSVQTVSSRTTSIGQVLAQDPSGGTNTNPGVTVTIAVSSGIHVPDVVGITQSSAESLLRDEGLYVYVKTAISETVPAGCVITQSPAAGTALNPGGSITITVSLGDGKTEVPDVTGYDQASAISRLVSAGFDYLVETTESDTIPAGSVISQTPAGGSRVQPGTRVKITVSSGDGRIEVPDVTGYDQTGAISRLVSAGFDYLIETAESDTVPAGIVLSQTPTGGMKARPGEKVTIVVSMGDSRIEVPDVTGYDQISAISILVSAGFEYYIDTAESDTVPAGNVISQTPAGGTTAKPGERITLVISLGPGNIELPDVTGYDQRDAGFNRNLPGIWR